jgi:hypothetical protein
MARLQKAGRDAEEMGEGARVQRFRRMKGAGGGQKRLTTRGAPAAVHGATSAPLTGYGTTSTILRLPGSTSTGVLSTMVYW